MDNGGKSVMGAFLVCALAIGGFSPLLAADAPAAPATSAPAAREIVPPPGFVRVNAKGHSAFCSPADQTWVTAVLDMVAPGTKPSTQPSDMAAKLKESRTTLVTQLTSSIGVTDTASAESFLDTRISAVIERAERTRIPLVYLVINADDLKKAVTGGWGPEYYKYDKATDSVTFVGQIAASIDGTGGESLANMLYNPADSADARAKNISAAIEEADFVTADKISRQCQSAVEVLFADYVQQRALKPLNMPLDQQWFDAGIVGYMSATCLAAVNGGNAEEMASSLSQPVPGNPVQGTSIDLLHPMAPEMVRLDLVMPYGDALRRRSIGVVTRWVKQSGPDAIAKTLAEYKANPPKDGRALLDLIQKTTGADLTAELAAAK